jgi:branched-chain amino acid transport system ATP-binding protein
MDVFYGQVQILRQVSLDVKEGEIVSLLGSNGAGKTTTVNAISGILPVAKGSIQLSGQEINKVEPHVRVEMGLVQIPVVLSMFPVLKTRKNQLAGTLSGGEQQMLAIGRGIMSRPRLLILDEPSLGLAPIIVDDIFDVIRKINGDGVTILLVEQNVPQALALSDRGFVMEEGRIGLSGKGKNLLADPRIKKLYLGL